MKHTAYDQLITAKREWRHLKIKIAAVERKIIRLRNRVMFDVQPAGLSKLSAREHQICDCLVAGLVNKEIAVKHGMSVRTVKFHVSAILRKTGLQSRGQLYGLVIK